MKTIYLARHAKSSWNMNFTKDFDRPLNKRGEADAVKMGEQMKLLAWLPEKIIASPAQRVKQTSATYCDIINYPTENIEWDAEIYEAYTITLLQILTDLDQGINSVMLIGHNPSMEDLLVQLCGMAQVSERQQADGKIMTTANIAKVTSNGKWKDLVNDEIILEKLLRPKEL